MSNHPSRVKACLFDMGNVLVRFSHPRMHAQMAGVLGTTVAAVERFLAHEDRQWRYESGLVSTDALFQGLQALATRPFERAALEHSVSDIFDPIADTETLVRELKQIGLRLVLVSNTNVLHLEYVRRRYAFLEPFDELVLSYAVQAMKPAASFYVAALAAAGCAPGEAVFIDDVLENVDGARRHGMHGHVFTTPAALRAELGRLGILPTGRG